MIRVFREVRVIPDCLRTDIESKGVVEQRRAISHFESEEAHPVGSGKEDREKFTFSTYSTPEVKSALKYVFNGKCGFCEIDYGGAACDVEHFRPKAALDGEDGQKIVRISKGYYWLGSSWSNLIYSCQHCNRGETHNQISPGGNHRGVRTVSGKRNLFPLSDESKRLSREARTADEEPFRLLLDPCSDDPRLHLEFKSDGRVLARMLNGTRSPMALASIRIYGLLRDPLVRKRRDIATKLLYAAGRLNQNLVALDTNPLDKRLRQQVLTDIAFIQHGFLASDRPFLALSRSMVVRHVDFARLRGVMGKAGGQQG
jgi:uncharacterized protein (TIGR02646 family)